MNIALISNGPSASAYPGHQVYDTVIGVNKVPTVYPCDWWVFTDFRTYCEEWETVLGNPRICCKRPAAEKIETQLHGQAHVQFTVANSQGRVVRYDEIEPLPPKWPEVCEWLSWSGCAALVFAASFKPEVIDVFGVDLNGGRDVRDEENFTRTDSRWPQEAALWERLMTWARDGCGVKVNHVKNSK